MTVPDLLPPGHKPGYRRLRKVLTRSAVPDRVPFYELFIEATMVERMTGRPLSPATEVDLHDQLGHDGGNFPPDRGRLPTIPVDGFRPWCRSVLEACREGGGYALGTGNSPATCVQLENFYAMHEVGYVHGRYDRAGGTS